LWFNGYVPSNRINSADPVTGKSNGIMGGPASDFLELDGVAAECSREHQRLENADGFNVLNRPGNPGSAASTGIPSTRSSGRAARQLQLTLRLTWQPSPGDK
jgi:hypothetical protein